MKYKIHKNYNSTYRPPR